MSQLTVDDVSPMIAEFVTMSDGEEYIRMSPDNWMKYYGQSIEYCSDHERLEAAYILHKTKQ